MRSGLKIYLKQKHFQLIFQQRFLVPADNTAKQPQRILFIYIELAGAKVSKDAGRRRQDGGRWV